MGRRGPFEMGVTSQQEVKDVFADIVDNALASVGKFLGFST